MVAAGAPISASAQTPFEWGSAVQVGEAVDVAGPRPDGRFVIATAFGPLHLFRPGGDLEPFGDGPRDHVSDEITHEPYIALGDGHRVEGAGCRFKRDHTFQIQNRNVPNVVEVNRKAVARNFATLPRKAFLSGITFDHVGRFGGRLLVTVRFGPIAEGAVRSVDVYAFDCRGRGEVVVEDAPEVEGGIVVAPASFEPYGGLLIAPDEIAGKVYAYRPNGSWRVIAAPGPPVGYDEGIENVAFVPGDFGAGDAAYVADRLSPLNDDPGTGALLFATAAQLAAAGVGPGDMIGVTESGLEAFRFECAAGGCTATQVGTGPDAGHGEGHIAFGPAP